MPQKKVLILFGPTASGKSNLALKVSSNVDATIINADSLQIYKNLRILTSRPTVEDEKKVAHKLYGVMDGVDNCSVAYWLKLVKKEIQKCWDRNKLPIVVGGTGMYLKALMEGISEIPSIPNSIRLETEEILKKNNLDYLYNEIFKGAQIILSTWEDEDNKIIDEAQSLGAEIILNKKPEIFGPFNEMFR